MTNSLTTLPAANFSSSTLIERVDAAGASSLEDRQIDCAAMRVALLTNEIPPYRVPQYAQLAATLGWDFRVFTCIDREGDRQWSTGDDLPFNVTQSKSVWYRRTIRRKSYESYNDTRQVHLPIGLWGDLRRYRPHVVISAEMGARTLLAALYARLFGAKLLVYFEGTPHTERHLTRAQRWLRKVLGRAPHAYLVNGRQGRDYVQSLGFAPDAIHEIGQATDIENFSRPISADERNALRRQYGMRGLTYIYCGRLIPLKGLDQLLDAWQAFSRRIEGEATLLFVGDGTERTRLEQVVSQRALMNVRFVGHVQREQLPALYRAADVFAFPTLVDCWSLAVVEAMASELPVINSHYSGSAELMDDGVNGWVIDPAQVDEIERVLLQAWQSQDRLAEMGAAAARRAQSQRVDAVSERIRAAVRSICPPATAGNSSTEEDSP